MLLKDLIPPTNGSLHVHVETFIFEVSKIFPLNFPNCLRYFFSNKLGSNYSQIPIYVLEFSKMEVHSEWKSWGLKVKLGKKNLNIVLYYCIVLRKDWFLLPKFLPSNINHLCHHQEYGWHKRKKSQDQKQGSAPLLYPWSSYNSIELIFRTEFPIKGSNFITFPRLLQGSIIICVSLTCISLIWSKIGPRQLYLV